jgi:hypothetical protein
MPIDKTTALAQIEAITARRKDLNDQWFPDSVQEITTLSCAAIKRLAPPGSAYLEQMESVLKNTEKSITRSREEEIEFRLRGILGALRGDYDAGRLQSFEELIHADLFSDFLEMAEYFLVEGYKDPAAVIAGGVLEEHLRKLCGKHGVTIPAKPKLDMMNADLAKAGAYNKNDQKHVTAWAGLRNDAAHGNYGNGNSPDHSLNAANTPRTHWRPAQMAGCRLLVLHSGTRSRAHACRAQSSGACAPTRPEERGPARHRNPSLGFARE